MGFARFQKKRPWTTPHGFRRCCLFQLRRLQGGHHSSILALTNRLTHGFTSCSLDALPEEEEGKRDVRGGYHIKAYFWSIMIHPSTLHSLSCSLQKHPLAYRMVLGLFHKPSPTKRWFCCSVLLASKIRKVYGRCRLLSYEKSHMPSYGFRCFFLPGLIKKR
jgi:hypothetical protein